MAVEEAEADSEEEVVFDHDDGDVDVMDTAVVVVASTDEAFEDGVGKTDDQPVPLPDKESVPVGPNGPEVEEFHEDAVSETDDDEKPEIVLLAPEIFVHELEAEDAPVSVADHDSEYDFDEFHEDTVSEAVDEKPELVPVAPDTSVPEVEAEEPPLPVGNDDSVCDVEEFQDEAVSEEDAVPVGAVMFHDSELDGDEPVLVAGALVEVALLVHDPVHDVECDGEE